MLLNETHCEKNKKEEEKNEVRERKKQGREVVFFKAEWRSEIE